MASVPTTLARLPPVLISFIAEALALEDLACLSLCNHRLSGLLEPQRNHLRSENKGRWLSSEPKQIRMTILQRLERDLPNYFACHICFLLHKYDGSQYYGPCELVSPLGDSELQCLAWYPDALALGVELDSRSLFKYHFSFVHVQLAMRRFYYGPSAGISTDSLFYTQVHPTHSIISRPPEQITLISIEAAICSIPATLCLRTQVIEKSRGKLEYVLSEWGRIPFQPFVICPHLESKDLWRQMKRAWAGPLGHRKAPSYIDTCRKCNTDFQIDIVANEPEICLIITTWFDLGPGLDPEDRRWTRHSSSLMIGAWFRRQEDSDTVDGEINVRESFENAASRSFEDSRSYNLSCLVDQRYKQVMRQAPEPHASWYLVHDCVQGTQ